jgi:hypothetical protein
MVSWVSTASGHARNPATKATEETDLHPNPVYVSTLGMTTNDVC